VSLLGALLCNWRGTHDPVRASFFGGFRCTRCKRVGSDLNDFGGDGYVNPESPAVNPPRTA
jgi:hypothetical protein